MGVMGPEKPLNACHNRQEGLIHLILNENFEKFSALNPGEDLRMDLIGALFEVPEELEILLAVGILTGEIVVVSFKKNFGFRHMEKLRWSPSKCQDFPFGLLIFVHPDVPCKAKEFSSLEIEVIRTKC